MPQGPQAGLAGDFTDLVAHVWAHVRLAGPGNAYDARYVVWATAKFDAETTELLQRDAVLIGRMWRDPLHLWAELHRTIAAYRRTATRSLCDVTAADVADPAVLRALQSVDGPVVELSHATLGVVAAAMERLHRDSIAPQLDAVRAPVDAALQLAAEVAPQLAARRIELAFALGPRGRAFPDRIVVGAPADWNGQPAILSAVLALHEHAVVGAATSDYVAAEWEALTGNAARVRRASPPLRDAYRQWLASLQLDALVEAAHRHGWLAEADADALRDDGEDRQGRLARLGAVG